MPSQERERANESGRSTMGTWPVQSITSSSASGRWARMSAATLNGTARSCRPQMQAERRGRAAQQRQEIGLGDDRRRRRDPLRGRRGLHHHPRLSG